MPMNPKSVIEYLRDCVTAEHEAAQSLYPDSKNVLLLEAGRPPLGDGWAPIPASDRAQRWLRARQSAAATESLWVAWPAVSGVRRDGDNRRRRVVAGLLLAEATVVRSDDGFRVTPTSRSIDLDEAAVRLLGVPLQECQDLVGEYGEMVQRGTVAALRDAVAFLRERGLVPTELDADTLGPFEPDALTSGAAVLWAGEAERSPFTRQLLDDLDALKGRSADELGRGPLGVVLGGGTSSSTFELQPTPAVLPTTLEQERAICSSLHCTLTVVTGPPGTGKSQVLANAVAAAFAKGETVLLASKNNHAIEVVHERLTSMHPDGFPSAPEVVVPGRSGPGNGTGVGAGPSSSPVTRRSRHRVDRAVQRVEEPYRRIADACPPRVDPRGCPVPRPRHPATAPARCHRRPDVARSRLPGCERWRARRRLEHYRALPDRWFWQRRRKRAAERELDESVATVAAFLGAAARGSTSTHSSPPGSDAVLDLATLVLELRGQVAEVADLEAQLSALPSTAAEDTEISASFSLRQPAAVDVFASRWHQRLRPMAPGRTAACATRRASRRRQPAVPASNRCGRSSPTCSRRSRCGPLRVSLPPPGSPSPPVCSTSSSSTRHRRATSHPRSRCCSGRSGR